MSLNIRSKRVRSIKEQIKSVSPIVRNWVLETGFELLKTKEYTIAEELIIEEVTEFFLKKLKELEG